MKDKVTITITVKVSETGKTWRNEPEGESEAVYTLPDHHNLPAPDIATLVQTAYDQYKAAQAELEAELELMSKESEK